MENHFTKEQILNFLKSQFIMSVATAVDNKPSASILLYAVDEDFHFFFGTHEDSYKSKNIEKNPQISLAIWAFDHMLVQVDGNVDRVTDASKMEAIMDELADSASKQDDFWPPVFRIEGGDYAIYEVVPTWLRALDLTVNTIRQNEPPFTELILS